MCVTRISSKQAATQHAVPADRFAREIWPFLMLSQVALAAAERQTVRRRSSTISITRHTFRTSSPFGLGMLLPSIPTTTRGLDFDPTTS